MTVKLNAMAFDHAKELTEEGRIVLGDRDEWSEHRPSPADERACLARRQAGRGPVTAAENAQPPPAPGDGVVDWR
ncbi:hypothetical protein [Streptomyces sp. Ag109_O5-10]|uniref:hypothetical protein n=1 Tax=Streptomyces sp. Ag109_O5-10 TaxID=1855349 RepID=UPI00089AACBB|nr:hypothetical protein [Streptomyces sp. Ag109_O5-10]SEE29249.1 hypothetical protein SAMN05216533_1888 [Streptomyces sp. Ag109_O5-10]